MPLEYVDGAEIPQLRTKLNERAHQRAMHELREIHRAEFDHLLQKHREEMGVYPDCLDMAVAIAAFRYDRRRRRVAEA
jgi:hypothetical protein